MKHDLPKYLEDVRLSIEDINKYISSVLSAEELEKNQLLIDALCRRFAIIGEAIAQADKIDPNISITDKKKIMGLRHIIVHDYDTVKPKDLWSIIKFNLPVLKFEIEELLKRFE